jgi:hypothetical protein
MRALMLEAGFARSVVCVDSTDDEAYHHNFAPLSR